MDRNPGGTGLPTSASGAARSNTRAVVGFADDTGQETGATQGHDTGRETGATQGHDTGQETGATQGHVD
jgi:hypothetical protein